MAELTHKQQIESVREALDASIKDGRYLITDINVKGLEELGVPLSPLVALNLRIQAREKYSEVVDKLEMLSNKGFASELEQLKGERTSLQQDSQRTT